MTQKQPDERAGAGPRAFSLVTVTLLKGVVYEESDPALWQSLVDLQSRVRDYFGHLGLELILDESEGYAFLRQRPPVEGEAELPRLVHRRQLSFPVSLLLALLRKKLAELDAASGETRLILASDEIADLMRIFLPTSVNEAKLTDKIHAHINKVVELGFLRRLRGQDDQYEVQRILKAFVDAQWLGELEARLAAYREHLASGTEEHEEPPS